MEQLPSFDFMRQSAPKTFRSNNHHKMNSKAVVTEIMREQLPHTPLLHMEQVATKAQVSQ
jgi:hypothetical protein